MKFAAALCLLAPVVSAQTVIHVQPGTPPFNSNSACTTANDNPLQAAIDGASPGDIIMMAAGIYELACLTNINKPIKIYGACSGIKAPSDPLFDPSNGSRDTCLTGESVIIASNDNGASNGALQGLTISSSDVTVDGLVFKETSATFRGFFNILSFVPAGTYSNIKIHNNYMRGQQSNSVYFIGGSVAAEAAKTIENLSFKGNFLKANKASIWEPLAFRGIGFASPDDFDPNVPILVNFELMDNTIGNNPINPTALTGPSQFLKDDGFGCQVFNFRNAILSGTTVISKNNFYETVEGDGCCQFTISSFFMDTIPVSEDNINADFNDCAGVVMAVPPIVPCPGGAILPCCPICHVSKGNGKKRTICVEPDGAANHLEKHEGDFSGECD